MTFKKLLYSIWFSYLVCLVATGSYVEQADLKVNMQPRLVLSSWVSCVHLPSADITGLCHHAWSITPGNGTFSECPLYLDTFSQYQGLSSSAVASILLASAQLGYFGFLYKLSQLPGMTSLTFQESTLDAWCSFSLAYLCVASGLGALAFQSSYASLTLFPSAFYLQVLVPESHSQLLPIAWPINPAPLMFTPGWDSSPWLLSWLIPFGFVS